MKMRLSQTEALVLRGREGTLTRFFPLPHATLSQGKTVPGPPPTCPVFAEVPPLPVTSPGTVTCSPKPRPSADLMAPPLALLQSLPASFRQTRDGELRRRLFLQLWPPRVPRGR